MKTRTLIALLALFAFIACEKHPYKKEDRAIEKLIAQCQNFSEATLLEKLPGKWKTYCDLVYNSSWSAIEETPLYMGQTDLCGGGWPIRTFTVDGTVSIYYNTWGSWDGVTYTYDWNYDSNSKKLTLTSREGLNDEEYNVKGISNEYLILDYYDTTNNHNRREILKRIAE
jgi:hypothetical protein